MEKLSRRSFVPMLGTVLLGASCLSFDENVLEDLPKGIVLPPRLKKGDKIGICAPAGPIKDLNEVHEFTSVLKNLGFRVKVGENVADQHGYFSADDQARAHDFMSLIEDEEVDGVFAIRGGWGCARMLQYLDFDVIGRNPKVILGFSDVTTLLNAITAKTGIVTFHGPSGNSSWNDYSVSYLQKTVMEVRRVEYRNTSPADAPIITYQSGKASGQLYGGNLSVIASLIGSKYLPDWKGKILFLEDVNEEPYRIDRMLTQLDLAGVFDSVAGIVLGGFRKCEAEEPDRSFTLIEVFEQHFSKRTYPIFYGAQIGHLENKFTIPVGQVAEIDADAGTIYLTYPAVS